MNFRKTVSTALAAVVLVTGTIAASTQSAEAKYGRKKAFIAGAIVGAAVAGRHYHGHRRHYHGVRFHCHYRKKKIYIGGGTYVVKKRKAYCH